MVADHETLRVSPNAAVYAASGRRWRWARSSASISTGGRRVARWGLLLTSTTNASQASTSSSQLEYSGSKLASVGTRSALETRTVASEPPLDSGSARTHVVTVTP